MKPFSWWQDVRWNLWMIMSAPAYTTSPQVVYCLPELVVNLGGPAGATFTANL